MRQITGGQESESVQSGGFGEKLIRILRYLLPTGARARLGRSGLVVSFRWQRQPSGTNER